MYDMEITFPKLAKSKRILFELLKQLRVVSHTQKFILRIQETRTSNFLCYVIT